MKDKKGFTLIEIIISLTLIVLIGTSSIFIVNKNNKSKEFYNKFDNALSVYLSEHNEIHENLNNNAEGVVISLELLKNEGLINNDIVDPETKELIDYKNNYYILSNAVLLESDSSVEKIENSCNSAISISVLKSWDLKNVDSSDVLYICPKNNEINSLSLYDNYIAKGNDPNNYVKVKYNSNESIWRILEINNGKTFLVGVEEKLFLKLNDFFNPDSLSFASKNNQLGSIYISDDIINFGDYIIERNGDDGNDGITIGSYEKYQSYVGLVSYTNILNASSTDGNWLFDIISTNKLSIGYIRRNHLTYYDYSEKYENIGQYGSFVVCYDYNSGCNNEERKIIPLITLKDNVELKSTPNCLLENKIGSFECPYILES